MARYLIVAADHGLCNRLLAMAHYAVIAERTGRRIRVLWPADEEVAGGEFDDVFRDDLSMTAEEMAALPGAVRFLEIRCGLRPSTPDDQRAIDSIAVLDEEVVAVTTSCYFEPSFIDPVAFHRGVRAFLNDLRPVAGVADAVRHVAHTNGIDPDHPRVIGLHVRRTDRTESARISTDEAFFEIVDRHLETDERARFLLATDDQGVGARYGERYGPRMIDHRGATVDGGIRRTSLPDAVIDLLLLARCHGIYGSYGSSFSKTAAIMRGVPFVQVGS